MHAVSSAPGRLTSLEGMRGYAVFLVFLVHHHTLFGAYLGEGTSAFGVSRFSHAIGNSGVDLFFVLSGFLIYGHLLTKRTPFIEFVRKRFWRIYPTFLAVVCIHLAISFAIPVGRRLPASGAATVVYFLENALFLPGIFNIEPLVTVTWSLSYEWFFYLCTPGLIAVLVLDSWRRRNRMLFFLSLFAAHCVGYSLGLLPHIRLSMFISGILLFEIIDGGLFEGAGLSRAGEAIAVVAYLIILAILGLAPSTVAAAVNVTAPLLSTVLLSMTVTTVAFYCVRMRGILNRVFSLPPVRWLGNISYSYFLIHGLILHAVAVSIKPLIGQRILPATLFLGLLSMNLLLTVSAALALFIAVEWRWSLAPASIQRASVDAAAVTDPASRPEASGACAP